MGNSVDACARWCRWPMIAPLGTFRRRDHRRAEDHRPRRSCARRDGRLLAGELGQTQFLPTHYFNYAVDYGGRRNLLHSPEDVIGSTAKLHRQRVEMAARRTLVAGSAGTGIGDFPWDQADLNPSVCPRSKWAQQLGVTYPAWQAIAERRPCRPRCCCRWEGTRAGFPRPTPISPPTPNGIIR